MTGQFFYKKAYIYFPIKAFIEVLLCSIYILPFQGIAPKGLYISAQGNTLSMQLHVFVSQFYLAHLCYVGYIECFFLSRDTDSLFFKVQFFQRLFDTVPVSSRIQDTC